MRSDSPSAIDDATAPDNAPTLRAFSYARAPSRPRRVTPSRPAVVDTVDATPLNGRLVYGILVTNETDQTYFGGDTETRQQFRHATSTLFCSIVN
jgi:hypothetical protein